VLCIAVNTPTPNIRKKLDKFFELFFTRSVITAETRDFATEHP